MRHSNDFKNPFTFKVLFSLVFPRLEYSSQIWNPSQFCCISMLENVQHKFPRFVSYKSNESMPCSSHNYESILVLVNMHTPKQRRTITDLFFIFKMLNYKIHCPPVLELLKLNVPFRKLRCSELFRIERNRTSLRTQKCFNRIKRTANELNGHHDFFNSTLIDH